jgi:hypothetical protein
MKNKLFSVVTTFNKHLYENYASKMLLAFDKYWPKEVSIHAYYEDMEMPRHNFSSRVFFYNFNDQVKDWYKFSKKFFFKELNKPDKSSYKYSASRFAHKVYSIKEQLKNNLSEYLIWLDCDVITIKNVNINFLRELTNKEFYLSYLGREHISYFGAEHVKFHSEASFLIFNTNNKFHKEFWKKISDMYDKGELFNLKEWHDSYVFDFVRANLETQDCKNFDISKLGLKKTNDILNVFDNSVLGKYMIHFKGNRKVNII